jgi:hypothetical protein
MNKKFILLALAAISAIGCGGGGGSSDAVSGVASNIRSVTADYTLDHPIDLYLGDQLLVNQQPAGMMTPYVPVVPGARPVVYRDDVTQAVVAQLEPAPPLTTGNYFTSLTWNSETGTRVLLLPDDHGTSPGKGKARFVYAAAGEGPVDVYLVAPGTDWAAGEPTFSNLSAGSYTPYVEFNPQWVEYWITKTGEKTPLFSNSLQVDASQVRTFALVRNEFGNLWSLFLQDFN